MNRLDGRSSVVSIDTASPRWRKSRHSNPNGACVEIASLREGRVAVRNSRHPDGAVLTHSPGAFRALVLGIKDGQFGGSPGSH